MITDADQTRLMRQQRTEEKRQVKELNQTGKRLTWVREKLEISQREVSEGTGIPPSSLCGREAGIRPELVEEFLVLSTFLNKKWQEKFNGVYPYFNGAEVKRVSTEWLMFGHDDLEANAELIRQEYKLMIDDLERRNFDRESELLRQLDILALIKERE